MHVFCRLPLSPPPPRSHLHRSIFHVPLSWLLENDQRFSSSLIRVPLVFDRILSHLEASGLKEEGILRVPGAAARIKHIRTQLETNFYGSKADDLKSIFDQVSSESADVVMSECRYSFIVHCIGR